MVLNHFNNLLCNVACNLLLPIVHLKFRGLRIYGYWLDLSFSIFGFSYLGIYNLAVLGLSLLSNSGNPLEEVYNLNKFKQV